MIESLRLRIRICISNSEATGALYYPVYEVSRTEWEWNWRVAMCDEHFRGTPTVPRRWKHVKMQWITDFSLSWRSFLLPLFERLRFSSSRLRSITRSSLRSFPSIFRRSLSAMLNAIEQFTVPGRNHSTIVRF